MTSEKRNRASWLLMSLLLFGVPASAQDAAKDAPYQAYDGPARPPEEVVLLTISPELLLTTLDGRDVYSHKWDGSVREGCKPLRPPRRYNCRHPVHSFQLLPGDHTAWFGGMGTANVYGPGCATGIACVFNNTFTVNAGKKYLATLHEEDLWETPGGPKVYVRTKYFRLSVEITEIKEQPADHKHGRQDQ